MTGACCAVVVRTDFRMRALSCDDRWRTDRPGDRGRGGRVSRARRMRDYGAGVSLRPRERSLGVSSSVPA